MERSESNATPVPVFEEETGYLCLSDGSHRQIMCRIENDSLFVWWKRDKKEVRVTLDELHSLFCRGGPKTA